MNMHQPFDATTTAHTTTAQSAPHLAAAPQPGAERDPRLCDEIMYEIVLDLGRDETYRKAAAWTRTFLLHALVVALSFAAWAAYSA